jgi:hypothetical protein
MSKKLPKTILLVGNHAQSHLEYIRKYFNGKYDINYLIYRSGDPFKSLDSNKIILNDLEIDFNGSYDINNLTLGLTSILEHQSLFSKMDLIIGDPTEVIFQAFSFARLNENPIFFKSNSQKSDFVDQSINLFIYPMGMICSDIRKEISNLLYVLKKHESQTLLFRREEMELDSIIYKILTDFNSRSIYELEDKIEGLEHLIGKPKELMT